MVGNNTPVFFIRDPMKFPDFIHTQKRNPQTNAKDADMFWDFLSLTPESIHQVTILFSDRGTPKGYRHMNGYSGHALMWYNQKGEYVWVKFHFKTAQGIQNFTDQEAELIAGKNPDHATVDLFEAIERSDHPAWDVQVQVVTPEQAKSYRFNPFDVTKVLPHGDFPVMPLGRMVLNRNPENYFAEVEQAAFSPGNFVPGIAASPDKMLQGRIFAYHDAHRYRLGPNYHLLPINAPKAAAMNNYQRDGFMRVDPNGGGGPNYNPNSFGGPVPDPKAAEPPVEVSGMIARHPEALTDDDFVQAGNLYRQVMNDEARDHLIGNIIGHLGKAKKNIQLRQAALLYKANQEYGRRVAEGIGLDVKEVKRLAEMSQEERVKETAG
jgi:catalase